MTIFDWMPCRVMDGVLVSEWEGAELDDCGFLKADILGLDQLDKFVYILRLIEHNHGVKLKLNRTTQGRQGGLCLVSQRLYPRRGFNLPLRGYQTIAGRPSLTRLPN